MSEHKSVEYWENFVTEQRKSVEKNADQLQMLVNELKFAEKGINPLDSAFEINNLPEELKQQLASQYQLKIPSDAEKPNSKNPSNWRQRTRAMRV